MDYVLLSFSVKDQFKRMFDSLQEGIVVLNMGEIEFMNDLSNKFMTFLATMYNFEVNNQLSNESPLNLNMFYLF